MYDITEKGERQYKRVKLGLYGLYILIPVLFLMGCNTTEEFDNDNLRNYYDYIDPKNIKCPTPMVAYCAGRSPNKMDCQCINREQQMRMFEDMMRQQRLS